MKPNDYVEVTKALTYAQRISAEQRHERSLKIDERFVEPLPIPQEPVSYELSLWDKIRLGPMLIPALFIIIKGLVMRDPKTTISGIVKAIFLVLSVVGINTGNLTEAMVTGLGYVIAEIYQAVWTPDKK